MGVSADVNPDLAALFSDPSGFANRLQQLKDAQAAYEKSLADLNLGKEARAAYDEAIAIRDKSARDRDAEYAKLQQEMKDSYEQLKKWSESTTATAEAKSAAAQQTMAEALSKHDEARAKLDQAEQILSDAKAKAKSLVDDANAAATLTLGNSRAESQKMLESAQQAKREADNSRSLAQAHEQELRRKLDSLNAAIAASA